MINWMSIKDETPPENEIFLGCDSISGIVSLARWTDKDSENEACCFMAALDMMEPDTEVTHWLPIPEIPQEIYD